MNGEPWGSEPAFVYGATFGPRQTRRHSPAAWIIGALVVLMLAGGAVAVHLWANRAFDEAAARAGAASAQLTSAEATAVAAAQDATDAVAAADGIAQAATGALADAQARTSFTDAAAALAEVVAAVDDLRDSAAGTEDAAKPTWAWELFAALPGLEAATTDRAADAELFDDAAVVVADASAALRDRGQALFATVPDAAAAVEKANVSAQASAVLDFRDAADAVAAQDRVGTGAEGAFARYADAAASLKKSAAAELAEKAGPLYDTRLEIEQYARSIAGGIVLDFDWAPFVIGIGGPYGMAGTSTWNTARGGYSTITLSDSVAENWPSADAMALVAHEVGHSITSKCSDLFDSSDDDANEEWATAWAISMGHTAEGNGIQAYGYPSQEMIDLAATCR